MVIFELLFNLLLTLFFIFAFIYMGITKPEPIPYQIGSEVWPMFVLGVLVIMLIANMINIVRKNKENLHFSDVPAGIKSFLKSKLFIQALMLLAYALIIEYIGFIPATLLLCWGSIALIGNSKKSVILLGGLCITVAVYIIFAWGLEVMLPRGYGIFRDFALLLEI